MAAEVDRGVRSVPTADLSSDAVGFGQDELRERMSGNLCRCGAYNGIVAAIAERFGAEAARYRQMAESFHRSMDVGRDRRSRWPFDRGQARAYGLPAEPLRTMS